MKITIEFDTDNAAFEDGFAPEVARVIARATTKIINHAETSEPGDSEWLHDTNGNRVGEVRFS